jgi:type II secretory pathway component PulK
VRVEVEFEARRLSVNTANGGELLSVFERYGSADAHAIVARIEDWRDEDTEPLPNGAELGDYRRAGLSYGPRNGSFESSQEIRAVLDVGDADVEWLDLLTAYGRSHQASVSPNHLISPGDVTRVRACARNAKRDMCRTAIIRLTGNRFDPLQIFSWM